MYGKQGSAFAYFIGEPWKFRHFGLFFLRFSQAMHEKTNGLFDLVYAKWAALVRPPVKLTESALLSEAQILAASQSVTREGCAVLPWSLPEEMLREIREFAYSTPAYGANNQLPMYSVSPGNFPPGHGRFLWSINDLLQLKSVQTLLSDSMLHRIAQNYLGARPVLTSVSLWMDVPIDSYFDPHVYHYDNDGPGFLKFFFYITDVTEATGAHRFVKGSHGRRKPAPLAASQRFTDEEVLEVFGKDKEVVFEAPAGTIIAEDTEGFHRGTSIQHDHRLLMQIQFSLIDIPHTEEFFRGVNKISLELPSAGQRRIVDKFVA